MPARVILVLLCCLIFTAPLFADQLYNDAKSETRYWTDKADELIGGTRTDDNRDSSTVRLRATDQASRDIRLSTPELHVGLSVKFGKIEAWQDESNRWIKNKVNKLKGEIESDWSHQTVTETKSPSTTTTKEDLPRPRAPTKDPWRFTSEKHLTIAKNPQFWLRLRERKDMEWSKLISTFFIEAGWSTKNLWESNSGFTTSISFAPRWVLAFGNQVHYGISAKDFTTSHGPSLSYIPGARQIINLSLGMGTAIENKIWAAESYSVTAAYRTSAWRDWFSVSINPFLTFSRASRFYGDPGVSISLEAIL